MLNREKGHRTLSKARENIADKYSFLKIHSVVIFNIYLR